MSQSQRQTFERRNHRQGLEARSRHNRRARAGYEIARGLARGSRGACGQRSGAQHYLWVVATVRTFEGEFVLCSFQRRARVA